MKKKKAKETTGVGDVSAPREGGLGLPSVPVAEAAEECRLWQRLGTSLLPLFLVLSPLAALPDLVFPHH